MSEIYEHGINIGISRVRNQFFVKMKIVGRLTHDDYEMITPLLENALNGVEHPNISLLIDATNFEGWSLQAVWDDLKLGLKHNKDFYKIALVGNKSWQEYGVKISNWFSKGSIEYFEKTDDALAWLSQEIEKKKPENLDTQYVNSKDTTTNEIQSRKKDIENHLELLFKTNMKITDWDVPEADDKKAAQLIVNILQNKLDSIKQDIKDGKYDYY
jgi:hypothetical protein